MVDLSKLDNDELNDLIHFASVELQERDLTEWYEEALSMRIKPDDPTISEHLREGYADYCLGKQTAEERKQWK